VAQNWGLDGRRRGSALVFDALRLAANMFERWMGHGSIVPGAMSMLKVAGAHGGKNSAMTIPEKSGF
jgi:hypothetical protein